MEKKHSPPKPYYDANRGSYWLFLPSQNQYINLSKADLSLHLRHAGVDGERDKKSGGLSDLERVFLVSQTERAVDYAGPLAGQNIGPFHTSDGKLVLVTRAIEPPKPGKPGPTPFLDRFLDELLGNEVDQLPAFLFWLKIAHESLEKRIFKPGQAIALAGPSNCGKSFLQVLVTHVLGGRVEKCFDYLSGKTTFNKELAEAEHWCIEDETATSNIGRRRDFGNQIKQATVNPLMRVHGKGLTGVTLPTWRRVTISLNDEPENLMILPPMDGSLRDKLMLFRCGVAKLSEDRAENIERLTRELPAFIAKLRRKRIPVDALRCSRMGIISYHNEGLLAALNEQSPEARLLELIEQVLSKEWDANEGEPWTGTAAELEQRMRSGPWAFAADKLLSYSSACGVYLQRLQTESPNRFEARKVNGRTKWIIRAP